MEVIVMVVLAALTVMAIQYRTTSAHRSRRIRVRADSRSSYRQTNVPDDRCQAKET